jgi:large subunit ribosomal protein L29
MSKASEFREMSSEHLALTLKDTTKNLFHLRLQAQTEKLDAPSELRKQRRAIARIKTIQNQRRRDAEKKAAAAEQAAAAGARPGTNPAEK